ncbi:MAG: class I SAM-dependent methyltransferase [Proteobacteria bacterium]|nr:class I SAM-dependent methyltransferase [Pseudomonadota bacterium]MBU1386535.1 class I SAM-dependent methyltransferase [Pseudomonadota bacterium]MBU1544646.1 class I SAM-dependent methyltransferase [Pseudomonadota bacterium]MBU2431125.1 class I SAM-dependent methyltransferase [Pseudomonadota bacterium]MBU2481375.1 class I SAM-dependent methyltransferase [Pseudomonadota bacterium]
MVSDNKTLDKVYTAQNSEQLMDAYKDWATKYDSDTVCEFGYVAHIESAKALDKALDDKECRILDAGCGTGLVAEELSKLGYTQMDALDYSKEMLEKAAVKKLYQDYIQADLNAPLDMPDDSYDAVVCTGTFTYGHVKPHAFNELVRVSKPGGIVCFTIREGAFEDYDYRSQMLKIEQENNWELLEMQDTDYLKNEGVRCKMCTYRVTK